MNLNLLLNEYINQKQADSLVRERSGKWNPSYFGRCFRLQYWNRENLTPSNPVDGFTQRRFLVGNIIHQFIQKLLPADAVEMVIETDDIKGYADIVTPDKVIDIKSVTIFEWKYIDKAEYDVVKKKHHAILQLMTYCYLLNKPTGQLSFIDIGTFNIREFCFSLDEWIDQVKEEIAKLNSFWASRSLPPAQPRAYIKDDGKSLDCTYCNQRDRCKAFELAEGRTWNG